jgi:hypothetical protein
MDICAFMPKVPYYIWHSPGHTMLKNVVYLNEYYISLFGDVLGKHSELREMPCILFMQIGTDLINVDHSRAVSAGLSPIFIAAISAEYGYNNYNWFSGYLRVVCINISGSVEPRTIIFGHNAMIPSNSYRSLFHQPSFICGKNYDYKMIAHGVYNDKSRDYRWTATHDEETGRLNIISTIHALLYENCNHELNQSGFSCMTDYTNCTHTLQTWIHIKV